MQTRPLPLSVPAVSLSVPAISLSLLAVSLSLLAAGCNRKAPTTPNYSEAIDAYYQAHPVCLWPEEKQFPVQEAHSDTAATEPYDALVDAGLLTRTTSEKKIVIVSKQENNYDLSANGRAAWTADPNQPGFGNFCYGHPTVSGIDSSSPPLTTDQAQPGAKVTVNYRYTIAGVPGWASAAETQTAFPTLRDNLAGPRPATATLTDTSNGWQVSSTNAPGANPAANADSTIVQ